MDLEITQLYDSTSIIQEEEDQEVVIHRRNSKSLELRFVQKEKKTHTKKTHQFHCGQILDSKVFFK